MREGERRWEKAREGGRRREKVGDGEGMRGKVEEKLEPLGKRGKRVWLLVLATCSTYYANTYYA